MMTDVQSCFAESLTNLTYVTNCNKQILTVKAAIILNLVFIIINLLGFLVMIYVVDIVKQEKYNPAPPDEEQEMEQI